VTDGDFLMVLPPYPVANSAFRGIWHGRNDHDPAHLWLRQIVACAVGNLPEN